MIESWTVKNSEIIADCKIFKVRRDNSVRKSDNQEFPFVCIENPDWVNIIPVTKDGKVVLIEQFRHGIGEITLEIPGGLVDEGEEAKAAAERELVEETGFVARRVIFLGKSHPNPAIQNNWVYHYLAIDCEKKHEPQFDQTESVRTKLVDSADIKALIEKGKITHSLVIAAFYWLNLSDNR